jgi:hypothetical protein
MRAPLAVTLAAVLPLTGCLDRLLLDGTLKSTRDAARAFDTLSDLTVAQEGAGSSLVSLEGMQSLAPDNEDALFLLTQGWTGYAAAFIEDAWERAVDRGDEEAEALEAERAYRAYLRGFRFGTQLLEQKRKGFVAAQRNTDTLRAYLSGFTARADAEPLLWVGLAALSRGGVAAERPEVVAELFIGVALLERSVELDPSLAFATGLTALGAYHARAPDAELPAARALFERALQLTGRKALSVQVTYAQNLACQAHDEPTYRALLREVLEAGEVLPEQRLENALARRKAERSLKAPRLKRCGFAPLASRARP